MSFIRYFQKYTHRLGLIVRPYKPSTHPDARLIAALKHFNIDLVLDVGANVGQYACMLMDHGFQEKIISFEPLTECHNSLMAISKTKSNWDIYERCAIGSEVGEIEINISENLVSSSVLNILDTHVQGEPSSKYIGKEKVNVMPLDAVDLPIESNSILLKIDVQGFEMAVLNGASKVLRNSKLVSVEMSFVPVYENNNVSWKEVVEFMENNGFYLYGIQPAFTDNNTGQVYQIDGIFARK